MARTKKDDRESKQKAKPKVPPNAKEVVTPILQLAYVPDPIWPLTVDNLGEVFDQLPIHLIPLPLVRYDKGMFELYRSIIENPKSNPLLFSVALEKSKLDTIKFLRAQEKWVPTLCISAVDVEGDAHGTETFSMRKMTRSTIRQRSKSSLDSYVDRQNGKPFCISSPMCAKVTCHFAYYAYKLET